MCVGGGALWYRAYIYIYIYSVRTIPWTFVEPTCFFVYNWAGGGGVRAHARASKEDLNNGLT